VTVVVLYFAALRDAMGAASESLSLPDDVRTVGDLMRHLGQRPSLEGKLGPVRVALNEDFVQLDVRLSDGDTVALIPPVQGG